MVLRHKMGSKFLLDYHLPIKVCLSIITTQKRRYGKLNLSIRIIRNMSVITSLVVTHTYHVSAKTVS
jgi:hypothetical protein